MILFSPAKINIGLFIIGRRSDGFHDLQSVMYPVGLFDILEIIESGPQAPSLEFTLSGLAVPGEPGDNLCRKAHQLVAGAVALPNVRIHLHKQIPVGAGLGGGSSNGVTTLQGLNRLAGQPLGMETMHRMASMLGSDCPFFLLREPAMMEGRGELLSPVNVDLKGHYLVLLFPGIHIPTPEAYAEVVPEVPPVHLRQLVSRSVKEWKGHVVNDFEKGIFRNHPELEILKRELYDAGALYASLSGSGSSLYGIFQEPPSLPVSLARLVIWKGMAGPLSPSN